MLLLPTSKNACGDNPNWNIDDAVMSTTVPVTKGDLYVPEYEMTRFSPGATSTVDCVIATDYYYDTPWCTRLAFTASSTSYDSVLPSATQQSSTQTSSPEATSGVTKSADKSSEDERRDVDIGTGVSFGILGLGILTFTSVRVKRKGWRSLKFWSWKKTERSP